MPSDRKRRNSGACKRCGTTIRSDIRTGLCRPCARRCGCGKPKDHRASVCLGCANRARALSQWADPDSRATIHAGIVDYNRRVRIRFSDISDSSAWQLKKNDRRAYTWYWDGDRQRTVYRSQWIWITAHGPIPRGHHVHHTNHDPTDDRLDNLQLLTAAQHRALHGADRHNALTRPCAHCGKPTQHKAKGGGRPRQRYCSPDCWYASRRATQPA